MVIGLLTATVISLSKVSGLLTAMGSVTMKAIGSLMANANLKEITNVMATTTMVITI
jgi:hypothetical protein